MASDTFSGANGSSQYPFRMQNPQAPSQLQLSPFEPDMNANGYPRSNERGQGSSEADSPSLILIRNLPKHTTHESLKTMLLFAKDLINAEFVPNDTPSDNGYSSAMVRFRTSNAAQEARNLLDGKQNSPNEAPLRVNFLPPTPTGAPNGLGARRNTFDTANSRGATSSASPTNGSRFIGPFQSMDRISPSNGSLGMSNGGPLVPGDLPTPDITSPFQPSFFQPQSPNGQIYGDRHHQTGKAVIGEDGADDEPGELLKDPVAYARNDQSGATNRRPNTSQLPTSRFGVLSLNTNGTTSPSVPGFASPRGMPPMQSPTSAMSPASMSNMGPNRPYQQSNSHFQGTNMPPVNPADQNPPCNTLYVGNLPVDTSEDELKTVFSKQRGYKRLCFRTKQNGPMCFVEFEDVTFATKSLHELYGHVLHNSVKGGIRLSFSKNPLGVRTGQPGSMGPSSPMSPQGPMPGMNGMSIAPFTTANGPPPGLAAPPGLGATQGASGLAGSMQSTTMMNGYGMGMNGGSVFGTQMRNTTNGNIPGNPGAQWPINNGIMLNSSGTQWPTSNGNYPNPFYGR